MAAKPNEHQNIAYELATEEREQIFRQSRHTNDLDTISLTLGNTPATLKNWSRRGIGFELPASDRSFTVGESISNVKILSADVVVFEGTVEIRFSSPTNGAKYYGAEFTSSVFWMEGIGAAQNVARCFNQIQKSTSAMQEVQPEFCRLILGLTSALRTVKQMCQDEEQRWKALPYDRRLECENVFLPQMATRVRDMMVSFNIQAGDLIDVEKLPEQSPYHQIVHEEIYPFFTGADLARRAYEKPRGYAGDYEMMNQIYRDTFEGDDLFGKILHNYIANETSSNSVKFRKPYFLSYYQKLLKRPGQFKVLSVASGPAVEVQEAVSSWPQADLDRLQITLFDLDREALEHAQSKIFESALRIGRRPQVGFVNASVKRFLVASGESAEKYDLIYSGGLFDYLDNLTSQALTRKLAARLNPGGTLIIGNFTKNNTTKAFCHLLTNWSLIHKTADEIRDWAPTDSEYQHRLEFDDAKINAFLVVTRNADS